ncbi:MAG TPA: amylo-alpha-1,6-glucosidase, partial [bacterium]|nr:amylo-alpha-1,6-glucosidase [bacterium]
GDGSSAATWMDAVIDGRAVTPRYGKPVEIEALWFNALSAMRDMGAVEGLHLRFPRAVQTIAKTLESLIALVQESFRNQFWSADRRQLADVVYRGKANWQLRPNQLFAAGLPFPLLDPAETALMLETLEACLLTKAGLRTLAPGDPAYRGQYRGSQPERDLSYHQGTVWPWLLGLYGRARLHADQDIIKTAKQLRNYLESFFTYLDELHLAYITEVFGGDDLQPGGTIQQAWNVSALLELFSILA